jgi:hypothetical protein
VDSTNHGFGNMNNREVNRKATLRMFVMIDANLAIREEYTSVSGEIV